MPTNAYLTMGPSQAIGLILGVLVFVAVLGGFAYLSKRISRGSAFSGRRIKVVDRMMLTRDSSILLVQIGSRLLAVGTGKGAPSFICEFSPEDFPEFVKKKDPQQKPAGFWGRFTKNMKAGFTGGKPAPPEEDASFAEVLRQISEGAGSADRHDTRFDPVPGEENAGDAGYPHLWEEEPRQAPPRFKRNNYQVSIENMARLSEPDTLDRRSRRYGEPPVRPPARASAPPPPPQQEDAPAAVSEEDRSERIDQLLDLIAQRQSRMDERKDTGDMG